MKQSEIEKQREARVQKQIERVSNEGKSDFNTLEEFWKRNKRVSNRSLIQRNSQRIYGLKSKIKNVNVRIGRLNRFYEHKTREYNEEMNILKRELEEKMKIAELILQGRRNETD